MIEPRRWTLRWTPEGAFAGFCHREGWKGIERDVVEAAPVEAELERLREEIASDEGSFREALTALKTVADQRDAIKTAARELLEALEDEDGVRGRSCLCGDEHCVAANRLREALGVEA
jgi:hypothetical protein